MWAGQVAQVDASYFGWLRKACSRPARGPRKLRGAERRSPPHAEWCVTVALRASLFGRPGSDRMSQQPEVSTIPANPVVNPAPGSTSGMVSGQAQGSGSSHSHVKSGSSEGPQRIPPWLERAELFLRVLLRMYIGIAVCYAPWSRLFWDQNPLFLQFPSVGVLAAHGAVRGLISGLGLLNLWIAFRDAVRHGEE
jgi:hypothetical protein